MTGPRGMGAPAAGFVHALFTDDGQRQFQFDVICGGANQEFIVAGFDEILPLVRVPLAQPFRRNFDGDLF